jgi:hypothetical protein
LEKAISVYFACRSPYIAPGGKYLKRFDDTVLDWFCNRWERLASREPMEAVKRIEREVGCHVFGAPGVFHAAAEYELPRPRNAGRLHDYFSDHVVCDGLDCASPHLLQLATNDDEIGIGCYFFDDHYLARHRDGKEILEKWLLFDDLWASAQPDLANSILRYTQR